MQFNRAGWPLRFGKILLVALIYILAAKVSLEIIPSPRRTPLVWPAAGISLGIVLLYGRYLAAGIFLGSLVQLLARGASLSFSLGIALITTLTVLAAERFLRLCGFRPRLDRIRDVFTLVVIGAICTPALGVFFKTALLFQRGPSFATRFWLFVLWGWLEESLGVLLFAPLVLGWFTRISELRDRKRLTEMAVSLALLLGISQAVFYSRIVAPDLQIAALFLTFGLVLWLSVRMPFTGGTLGILIVFFTALSGLSPMVGLNPASPLPGSTLSSVLSFIVILACASLAISAIVSERGGKEDALLESEQRLRSALDVGRMGAWSWSLKANEITWSERVSEILGLPKDVRSLPVEDCLALVHPDDRQGLTESLTDSVVGRSDDFEIEFRFTRKDGVVRWMRGHGGAIRDANLRSVSLNGTVVDITNLRNTEKSVDAILRNTATALGRDFLVSLVRELASVLSVRYAFVAELLKDNPTRVRTVALCIDDQIAENLEYDLAGTPCEEVVGQSLCFYPRDVQSHFPKDSMLQEMDVQAYLGIPLFTAAAEPLGLVVVLHDKPLDETELAKSIMRIFGYRAGAELERVRNEDALRESEARYRAVIETLNEGIVVQDQNRRFIAANKRAEEITGVPLNFFVGKLPDQIGFGLIEESGSPVLENDTNAVRVLKTGRPIMNRVLGFVMPGKPVRWMLTNTLPLFLKRKSEPDGIVTSITDITESRELEDAKRDLELQLFRAQKLEAIGTLAGGIAHDFNNILSSIYGHAELAQRKLPDDSAVTRHISSIYEAADRAKDLVGQILAFSRKQDIERKPIQLHYVVAEALKLIRASIPSTIEIRSEIEKEDPPVLADPTQVHQVVMNLCTNAAQAISPETGEIGVRVAYVEIGQTDARRASDPLPGEYMKLEVSDTGTGIDTVTQARIFDPFFTTKAPGEGTGLGLAVVHGIVSSHRGFITLESEVGRGTTFRVFFPVLEAPTAVELAGTDSIPRGNGQRILVVDDEEMIVGVLVEMIEDLGYVAIPFFSPAAALNALVERPDAFDLVITDLTMPGSTGTSLARDIKKVRNDLPILLTTGFPLALTVEKVRSLGFEDVLPKPVSQKSLANSLFTNLSRTGANLSAPGVNR